MHEVKIYFQGHFGMPAISQKRITLQTPDKYRPDGKLTRLLRKFMPFSTLQKLPQMSGCYRPVHRLQTAPRTLVAEYEPWMHVFSVCVSDCLCANANRITQEAVDGFQGNLPSRHLLGQDGTITYNTVFV